MRDAVCQDSVNNWLEILYIYEPLFIITIIAKL